ncbi:hypothetical protein HKD37_01G001691 [Glycine soja]
MLRWPASSFHPAVKTLSTTSRKHELIRKLSQVYLIEEAIELFGQADQWEIVVFHSHMFSILG